MVVSDLEALERPAFGLMGEPRRRMRDDDAPWWLEVFYFEKHALIMQAIATAAADGSPIDGIIVADRLAEHHAPETYGGRGYLAVLLSAVANPENVFWHVAILVKHWRARLELAAFRCGVQRLLAGEDPVDVGQAIFDGIRPAFAATAGGMDVVDYSDPQHRAELLARAKADEKKRTAVLYPWAPLNAIVKGCRTSTLVLFRLKKKGGKTSLLTQCAESFAMQLSQRSARNRVLFFSCEDNPELITTSFVSQREIIARDEWNAADRSEEAQEAYDFTVNSHLPAIGLVVINRGRLTPKMIDAQIEREKQRGNRVRFVFLDYLQKMHPSGQYVPHAEKWDAIMGELRETALRHDIGIVIAEQRGEAREGMQDRGYQTGQAAHIQCDLPIDIEPIANPEKIGLVNMPKDEESGESEIDAYTFRVQPGKGTKAGKFRLLFWKKYALWGEISAESGWREFHADVLDKQQKRIDRLRASRPDIISHIEAQAAAATAAAEAQREVQDKLPF